MKALMMFMSSTGTQAARRRNFWRHDFAIEDVQSVCFSSDGRHLFTSTPRGVWRWDLGWYQPKTVDAMLEKLRRTFPEAAAKITEADVLAAWPLVNEDIGKNVFEWLPD